MNNDFNSMSGDFLNQEEESINTETLVILEEIRECPWSNTKEYSWYTKHPVIQRVGFEYDEDSIFEGSYIKSYSKLYGEEKGYIPYPVLEQINCIYKEEKEQVSYGQDLFNEMLLYYHPEALPEVVELLDKLHNEYRGQIDDYPI